MEGKIFEVSLQDKIAHLLSVESQCDGCGSDLKFTDKSYFHNMYYGEFCHDCYKLFCVGKLPPLITNLDKIPLHDIIS